MSWISLTSSLIVLCLKQATRFTKSGGEPVQDVITPGARATALGLTGLLVHLLGDAAAPSVIGLIADRYTLSFALITTTPTFLFLAGLACLVGTRTVARDMRRMQEQMRDKIGS